MPNEKKPLRLLKWKDWNRERPDAEAEDTKPTVKRYFVLLFRKFWKLIPLNVMMLFTVIPVILPILLYIGAKQTPTETEPAFSALYGIFQVVKTPTTVGMLDLFGSQTNIPVYQLSTYIHIGLCLLFLLITFGWQNVGATYVLRGLVRGDAVFVWSDYFYAVRRNLKKGFLLGLLDLTVLFLLIFDIGYFSSMSGTFFLDFMFFAICAIAILYFFMRFYLYLLLVTFELPIRKILKNALIFTMLGIKRNLMGFLGILLITAVAVGFIILLIPLNIAIPIILPFFYYLSFTAFTAAYAAYPVIEKYMITPYQNKNSDAE